MPEFRADLHIHSVLSPCGDLEMSPSHIVAQAQARGLQLIALTDHNSTLHAPLVRQLAARVGIYALLGAEVTTSEEVHCVCLFDTEEQRQPFQAFLEANIQRIPNNVDFYGYQLVVDAEENVIDEVDYLLISTTTRSTYEVQAQVAQLRGLFIPAHIDKPKFSLTSQLGFVPPDLPFDALEISRYSTADAMRQANPLIKNPRFIRSSDAHFIDDIAQQTTTFVMPSITFEHIRSALHGTDGCDVIIK